MVFNKFFTFTKSILNFIRVLCLYIFVILFNVEIKNGEQMKEEKKNSQILIEIKIIKMIEC